MAVPAEGSVVHPAPSNNLHPTGYLVKETFPAVASMSAVSMTCGWAPEMFQSCTVDLSSIVAMRGELPVGCHSALWGRGHDRVSCGQPVSYCSSEVEEERGATIFSIPVSLSSGEAPSSRRMLAERKYCPSWTAAGPGVCAQTWATPTHLLDPWQV